MNATSDVLSWYVCHTRPRCEKKFAALMAAENFEHYLPLVKSVRRYSGRAKQFTKPLFPGYVFTRVADGEKPRMYQQDLLARAIAVKDEPRFLLQLEGVRRIVASGLALSLHPLLKRGTQARVINGPLQGLVGIIDNTEHPQGIVLAVDVMQQGLRVRIPLEDLEPLP